MLPPVPSWIGACRPPHPATLSGNQRVGPQLLMLLRTCCNQLTLLSLESWTLCCCPGNDTPPSGPSGWLGGPLKTNFTCKTEIFYAHHPHFLGGTTYPPDEFPSEPAPTPFLPRCTRGTLGSVFVLNITGVKPKVLF